MDKNTVRKITGKVGILMDTIKSLVIIVIILVLIVSFVSIIIHNILRFGEVSSKYSGEYKNLYSVKNNMMNLYITGEGENTIVILPSVGVSSPVLEYKAIADSLSSDYRVVIVEYFGYGFSLSINDERSNKEIASEIKDALTSAEIFGPYIFMPFSTSNLYAMYYSDSYPEEVLGIISVNGIYPEELYNKNFKNNYLPSLKSNVKFYSLLSFTGIFRWQSYLDSKKFNIGYLQDSKYYDKAEIKIYRNLLANKFLTKPMRNEIDNLQSNMEELKDYTYSEDLVALQILTKSKIQDTESRGEKIEEYAENLITNPSCQDVEILDKELSEYLFKSPKTIKNLIDEYFLSFSSF